MRMTVYLLLGQLQVGIGYGNKEIMLTTLFEDVGN